MRCMTIPHEHARTCTNHVLTIAHVNIFPLWTCTFWLVTHENDEHLLHWYMRCNTSWGSRSMPGAIGSPVRVNSKFNWMSETFHMVHMYVSIQGPGTQTNQTINVSCLMCVCVRFRCLWISRQRNVFIHLTVVDRTHVSGLQQTSRLRARINGIVYMVLQSIIVLYTFIYYVWCSVLYSLLLVS